MSKQVVSGSCIEHILVVFDRSAAARRALLDAAAIADEHDAEISVVTLIEPERRTLGRCLRSGYWNRVLDEVARADLEAAAAMLGDRDPVPRFDVIRRAGGRGLRDAVATLGADLVLVPRRGPLPGLSLRRLRRGLEAEVVGVRPG